MRRVFVFLMVLAVAGFGFAAGRAETAATSITVLSSAQAPAFADGSTMWGIATEAVEAKYPGTVVEILQVDLSDGSTLTMDAMLAAGRAPDVYFDFIGRASKYLVLEFALPLQDYMDLKPYTSLIEAFTRDGDVLGLPFPGGGQAMAINLEIMSEIGYTVPDRWTVDDFLEMAELVKRHYDGTKFATGMFAANQSGDYLINNWFGAFGAQYFRDGYARTTIAETGGAKVYEFFQTLARNGYMPPDAATLTDDDYVIQWAKGDLAATAFFEQWTGSYFDAVIKQGLRKEPFEYVFVPFPRTKGVENVPGYMSFGGAIARKSGDEAKQRAAVAWIEGLTSVRVQDAVIVQSSSIPTRSDTTARDTNPRTAEIAAVIAAGGVMDVGLTSPFFSAIRPQHYPILQRVLNLAVTPDAAIREYAAAIDGQLK